MHISATELKVIETLAKGDKTVKSIVSALKKSDKQIYRVIKRLEMDGMIERIEHNFEIKKTTHLILLSQLLIEYPSLIKPFSNSGINILTSIIQSKTIEEIMQETQLKKAIIYRKLTFMKAISIILKSGKKYAINENIWPKVKEFLIELDKFERNIDKRVPINAIIYYKNEKEIVFSTPEIIDAAITGFSAYLKYEIKILSPTTDYYLPKKKISKKEIFIHSLYITEKDKNIRNIIYIALFYLKFKKELSRIKHHIIENIKLIIKGQRITEYPTIEEIKEKCEIYDIRI